MALGRVAAYQAGLSSMDFDGRGNRRFWLRLMARKVGER